MQEKEEKYISLLLNRCLNVNKSKSLFISYNRLNKKFIDNVINMAKELGFNDIEVDEEDSNVKRQKLLCESIEEIESDQYFDKSKWDEYAKKNANFLMIETEIPNFFDDVDPKKIAKAKYRNRETRKLFREKETTYQIPWCIAAYPNEYWAKSLFPNNDNSYQKLFDIICSMCMVDEKDPILSWNKYLKTAKERSLKLNSLEIKTLTYKNSLGTNLTVSLPKNIKWASAAEDKDMFVNMPSYEIFTSPDYRYTNGIVYSSKPLVYGGGTIEDFYIEFKDGKVINYNAKKGKEILKSIIESDSNSCYLGEVALVNNNSPISNTNLVFGTTLFDENASCHLALGDGFSECLDNGSKLKKSELLEKGINQSTNHVDFMIGTKDLEIEAETTSGKQLIFKNGNFVI